MLKHALKYHEEGFSIIPIRPDKRPLLAEWAHYQKERPTKSEVEMWWFKHPNAMIGIITGKVSGVCVVDADSPLGYKHAKKYIKRKPDVRSPNGWHWYFKYEDGITCSNRFLPDVDLKSEGGYIIAPPSANGTGKPYKLTGEIGGNHLFPAEIKGLLEKVKCYTSCYTECYTPPEQGVSRVYQGVTTPIGTQGRRDDDMFRLANYLVKGGLKESTIREYLYFYAGNCTPPFPEKDVEAKIQSALKRDEKHSESFIDDVRDWIDNETGLITNAKGYVAMQCNTKGEKAILRMCLKRLADDKQLVRTQQGAYRKMEDTVEWLDVETADTEPFPIVWPFDIESRVKLPPGSITLVGGQQGAGKTAFLLNLARLNANRGQDIVYISTETNAQGLRVRLEGFGEEGVSVGDLAKSIKFGYHSGGEMCDIIDNYNLEDSIVILDYLEMTDAFYLVGEKLANIFRRMKNGVAIIGLQMHGDRLLGGQFGFHKPDMVLTLRQQDEPLGTKLTIEKARWWGDPGENPVGDEITYWTRHGCLLVPMRSWGKR